MGTRYCIGSVGLKREAVSRVDAEIDRLDGLDRALAVVFVDQPRAEGENQVARPYLQQQDSEMSYGTASSIDDLLGMVAVEGLLDPPVQFIPWDCEEAGGGYHVLVNGLGIVDSGGDGVRLVDVGADTPAGEVVVPVRAYCDGRGQALVLGARKDSSGGEADA